MIYCKDCSTTDCPYQKEKEERENNPFKKILGCNEDEVQHHHPRKRGGISMSDILIKGMEMPRSCISCHLNFGEKRPEYGLTIYCPYSDGVISWRDKAFDNGRLASCGIIPVPPKEV